MGINFTENAHFLEVKIGYEKGLNVFSFSVVNYRTIVELFN